MSLQVEDVGVRHQVGWDLEQLERGGAVHSWNGGAHLAPGGGDGVVGGVGRGGVLQGDARGLH